MKDRYIRNAGSSVELFLDGDKDGIKNFLQRLKKEHPPLANLMEVIVKNKETCERFEDGKFADLNGIERKLLESFQKPIVVLKKKTGAAVYKFQTG
ncbi:MAG: acylphosphatase [Euryarchaeota archaeon]|nr:acylphosphatase [Euryarchaeota archaeon]MBU4222446.1 acylphosphatase [Euryarchaeota archaeon]MBU4340656.1 acylphosphatase [Euryarchaeota archaeon]MBU4454620.1 acylphosphatase [Euryarchaeota archaeon]